MTKPESGSRGTNTTTILVAVVSFYCGLAARRMPWWLAAFPAVVAAWALFWFFLVRALSAVAFGVQCPSCGRSTLERRSVVGFGDRFYGCSACGARYKRMTLGPWSDASGPEFDHHYVAGPVEDPWSRPPDLEDGGVVLSKTHALLVRSKRRRHPDEPNGPGLPT